MGFFTGTGVVIKFHLTPMFLLTNRAVVVNGRTFSVSTVVVNVVSVVVVVFTTGNSRPKNRTTSPNCALFLHQIDNISFRFPYDIVSGSSPSAEFRAR